MSVNKLPALLRKWQVPLIPCRGIVVEHTCVPLVKILARKHLCNGTIVSRTLVDIGFANSIASGDAEFIRPYRDSIHDRVKMALASRVWVNVIISFDCTGMLPLFDKARIECLIVSTQSYVYDMEFLVSPFVKYLKWKGPCPSANVLAYYPRLICFGYQQCKVIKRIIVQSRLRILVCYDSECKCYEKYFRNKL
uniref:Recep_L_domain domain-containing protein n=1 Tax=Parastrongyloides trichosuri TaxID=131310 RepID=A0A0N5A0Q9_PARTI